jgi:hypothetical protein
MKDASIHKIQARVGNRRRACRCLMALLVCGALIPAGCVRVTPQQQRLVSKPNMQFSGSAIFNYQDRLLSQFESGSASSVGGRSGDCGSCAVGGAQ